MQSTKKYNIDIVKDGDIVGRIQRVVRGEQIGNFNPFFCTYKGKKTLVKSRNGDISDPFRRDPSWLHNLFVEQI